MTPTLIAVSHRVTCFTSGSSARTGKLEMRSISERTSLNTLSASAPVTSSSVMAPTPSLATAVRFLIPSTARTASSIFWQMPSSISSGVAPG